MNKNLLLHRNYTSGELFGLPIYQHSALRIYPIKISVPITSLVISHNSNKNDTIINCFDQYWNLITDVKIKINEIEIIFNFMAPFIGQINILINSNYKPVIHEILPPAFTGVNYVGNIFAIHGRPAYTYELIDAPEWININSDGVLSGVPPNIGTTQTINITCKITDFYNISSVKTLQLIIVNNKTRRITKSGNIRKTKQLNTRITREN